MCQALLNLQRPLEAADEFLLLPEGYLPESNPILAQDLTRELRTGATQKLKKTQLSEALEFVRRELQIIQQLRGALRHDCLVQEVEVSNLLGWILEKMKRLPEAREAFQQACRLSEVARDEDDPLRFSADARRAHWDKSPGENIAHVSKSDFQKLTQSVKNT